MNIQKYPHRMKIFKGENRFCIIPIIKHIAGYSIDSEWYKMFDYAVSKKEIGESIFVALNVIDSSSIAIGGEGEPSWIKASKYKSWKSFSNHNIMIMFDQLEDKSYDIWPYSGEELWHVLLPETATAEETGEAILNMFAELEKMGVKKLYRLTL